MRRTAFFSGFLFATIAAVGFNHACIATMPTIITGSATTTVAATFNPDEAGIKNQLTALYTLKAKDDFSPVASLTSYMTEEFGNLLIKDAETEGITTEYDPFLNAQDIFEHFIIQQPAINGAVATVGVELYNGNEPDGKPRVILLMEKRGEAWLISDLFDPESNMASLKENISNPVLDNASSSEPLAE